MNKITTIGVDLAKSVFQLHGVDGEGTVVLRRQLRRSQMLEFFQRLPDGCLIGMEACAGAHYWARELTMFGYEVRLMQPSYVKGYVKRGKTDAADAEAICEAVSRPSMRFVPVKSEETQGQLVTHKAREFLVRQQTQLVNAIRAHLGEFGITIPKGIQNVDRLIEACENGKLPAVARKALNLLADQLVDTQKRIAELSNDIHADAKASESAMRLQTRPHHGQRLCRVAPGHCRLQMWQRFIRLDWPYAQAAFVGRQRTPGANFKNGEPIPASSAVFGCVVTGQRPQTRSAR